MVRTVWIAAFCLAVLGGLFATRVTASMPSTEEAATDPTEISTKLVQDTLTKADKLDVSYFRDSFELPIESIVV
jgi:apolipoprotein N-acyltransferase